MFQPNLQARRWLMSLEPLNGQLFYLSEILTAFKYAFSYHIFALKIIMWHLFGYNLCSIGLLSLPRSLSPSAPHPTSLSSLVVCCWGCATPSASCESEFNTCKYSKQSINQKLRTICTCQSVHTHSSARTHTLLLIFTVANRPSALQQPTGSRRSPTFTYDYICLILQWGCCCKHVCFPECQRCI